MSETKQISKKDLKVCRDSHLAAKQKVWGLYTSWRESDRGKQWKAEFLQECKYCCPECSRLLTDYNSTIDHKLPRKKYPWLAWDVANLWVLCRDCNQAKSHKDWSEYVEAVRRDRGKAAYQRVTKYSPCR